MNNHEFETRLHDLEAAIKSVRQFGESLKSSINLAGTEDDHIVDKTNLPVDLFNKYISDISEFQGFVPEMTASQVQQFQDNLLLFKQALQDVQSESEKLCAITAASIKKSRSYNKGASAYLKATSTN